MSRMASSYLLYLIKNHHIAYVPIESKANVHRYMRAIPLLT